MTNRKRYKVRDGVARYCSRTVHNGVTPELRYKGPLWLAAHFEADWGKERPLFALRLLSRDADAHKQTLHQGMVMELR